MPPPPTHRRFVSLSVPVLLSLIAEPLTALVDTAWVARLGAAPLAALGVGTMILSSVFWIVNFLGIGTQTRVAASFGADDDEQVRIDVSTALAIGLALGTLLALIGPILSPWLADLMQAEGDLRDAAVAYMRVRWLGAPALVATLIAFGALRGRQEMKRPMYVALLVNLINLGLDPLLMFGAGPIPAFGLTGAAWATVAAQYVGAVVVTIPVLRSIGGWRWPHLHAALTLITVGRDLIIRTAALSLFLVLATREATALGAVPGAAHQAIRQVWMFTALFLDAFAITGQSLAGYELGRSARQHLRAVDHMTLQWSIGTGVALAVIMWLGTPFFTALLVPPEAHEAFLAVWWIAAIGQPLNAITFGTDGLLWARSAFGFLRNVVVSATVLSGAWLLTVTSLNAIWGLTVLWIAIRAAGGLWGVFGRWTN